MKSSHKRNVGLYKALCIKYKTRFPRIHGAKVNVIKFNTNDIMKQTQTLPNGRDYNIYSLFIDNKIYTHSSSKSNNMCTYSFPVFSKMYMYYGRKLDDRKIVFEY